MKNFKLAKNTDNTFNVIDIRTGKEVKHNLRGTKAAAYAEYMEQQIVEAEKFWA